MAVKTFKPTSAGRRHATMADFSEVSRKRPEKSLLESKSSTGARNNTGRITSRFRGGGHKQKYRLIDFKRNKPGVPARVAAIEYDPNRTCRLALLNYADGEKRYILQPVGLRVGDTVVSGENVDIKPGNSMPLANVPVGTVIHNLELRPGKGGQLVRSAGAGAQLMAKEGAYAQVRMPSGEVRKILMTCFATIGQVGNLEHENVALGKAGRSRWLGRRPHNRGVTMNPIDHPHGGGEGKTSGGRHPVTPWGQPTRGHKTRQMPRTDNMIIKRRK